MKTVLTFFTLCVTMMAFAQINTIFYEDFEGDLTGWSVGDLDGDGFYWESVYSSDQAEQQGWGPDMTSMVGSFGYSLLPGSEEPLSPDNLLISPAIELPLLNNLKLSFLLGTNVDYLNNHNFALYVVPEFNTFDESWEPFFEMNFEGISTAQNIVLDLTDFAGSTQQFVFRHYDSDGQFVLLMDDMRIVEEPLSVNESSQVAQLSVYPNPAKDYVQIETEEPILSIELFDTLGKLLQTTTTKTLDIQDLPKGLYLLKIKTENAFFTKKLLKN